MVADKIGSRVLIYSHDTFGLGHLRRCRTIAHALVERFRNISVLILSGSPIIGSFDFRSRVDFVRVPGVVKLRNGEYTPLNLHIDIDEMLTMRAEIIRHTAEIFAPDVFIVDKEPLGLRGEVGQTLSLLRERGTRLVLGLRDVMDEPASLAPEWRRKNVMPALRDLYDEIWVYDVAAARAGRVEGRPRVLGPRRQSGLGAARPDHRVATVHGSGEQRRSVVGARGSPSQCARHGADGRPVGQGGRDEAR